MRQYATFKFKSLTFKSMKKNITRIDQAIKNVPEFKTLYLQMERSIRISGKSQ